MSESARRILVRCLLLGLEEREEAREHVAGVVVDVFVDKLLGRGRVGSEEEPRVRALLALDLLAERARALDHDAVEQLARDARGRLGGRLAALDGRAHGRLLRCEALLLLLEVVADARHLHAELHVVAEVGRVGELRRASP